MKFRCTCGETISDNAEFLHYKARLIADQDWFDFLESEVEGGGHDWRMTSTIYQCSKCGRLILFRRDGHGISFKPEEEIEENKQLLCSLKGAKWKRPLIGTWDANEKFKQAAKGRIYFQDSQNEGFEKFDDWTLMEKRYFEILELLKQSDTLRSALLRKDGKLVHQWPGNSVSS